MSPYPVPIITRLLDKTRGKIKENISLAPVELGWGDVYHSRAHETVGGERGEMRTDD